MYAVKKLTVIGRIQSREDADVERITGENHRRRRVAAEKENAWKQYAEEQARKSKKAANRRAWLQYASYFSFAVLGASLSTTAAFMALGDMLSLRVSMVVLFVSVITSLICAAKLEQ